MRRLVRTGWLLLGAMALLVLVCGGCVRSNLDLRTAQTAHVVRVQGEKFANAYTLRAVTWENADYDRAVDETFAALAKAPTTQAILDTAKLVKDSARARDAQIDRIRTDRADFQWYMDLLGDVERGYTQTYEAGERLKAMFTGKEPGKAEMPPTTGGSK